MKKIIAIFLLGLSLNVNAQTSKTIIYSVDDINYELLNDLILDGLNKSRKKRNAKPMTSSVRLVVLAGGHNTNMKEQNRLFHSNNGLETCRGGYDKFVGLSYRDVAKNVIEAYKNSRRHWDILMNPSMRLVGMATIIYDHEKRRYNDSGIKRIYNTINLSR